MGLRSKIMNQVKETGERKGEGILKCRKIILLCFLFHC